MAFPIFLIKTSAPSNLNSFGILTAWLRPFRNSFVVSTAFLLHAQYTPIVYIKFGKLQGLAALRPITKRVYLPDLLLRNVAPLTALWPQLPHPTIQRLDIDDVVLGARGALDGRRVARLVVHRPAQAVADARLLSPHQAKAPHWLIEPRRQHNARVRLWLALVPLVHEDFPDGLHTVIEEHTDREPIYESTFS